MYTAADSTLDQKSHKWGTNIGTFSDFSTIHSTSNSTPNGSSNMSHPKSRAAIFVTYRLD
jgi:hypothetical protein